MQNIDAPSPLKVFFEERFRSDPWNLIDFFNAEISDTAASVGVKWSAISGQFDLRGGKYRPKKGEVTDKKHLGKVMSWGDMKRAEAGFDYPSFTFLNNNPAIGHMTWSGLMALSDLYQREKGTAPSAKHTAWLKKQAEQKAEREAARLEAERRAQETEERIQGERLAFESVWHCGGRVEFKYEAGGKIRNGFVELIGAEDGNAPYLLKKQIGAIASHFKMKRMRDSHGEFTAVPMYSIAGVFLGIQRLYADKKMQGTGVKMDGAHCIIGDLETATVRYSSEGFATGASAYLAELEAGNNVAVIVTFNVDNLKKVVSLYKKHMPDMQIRNLVDNDQWKPHVGNAGVLAALELARECNSPAIVPDFTEIGPEAEAKCLAEQKGPTDWNDYHVEFGLKATAKALRARASVLRPYKAWFDYCLQRLTFSGLTADKVARQTVNAGMMLVPIKYSVDQVLHATLEAIRPEAKVDQSKLKSFAHWLAKQKLTAAAELRSFSPATLDKAHIHYLRVEGIRQSHGNFEIPAHLVHLIESLEGAVILRAPMGSGKTEKIIAPLIRDARKGAYIAHRVSLLDDAAARLNRVIDSDGNPILERDGSYKMDNLVHHYKQVHAAWMRDVSHLACCVNSMTASKFYNTEEMSWFTTVDTLCIDEASQVVSHITSGPVEGRVRVMDALIDAVGSATRVLLCDADANDNVVEFCELARPGQRITIIEVAGTADHIRVDHCDDESAWQQAVEWIGAGKRVLVANDSVESGKKMAALIEAMVENETIKPVSMLLVHQGNKGEPDVAAFLQDPDSEALKYDVLIYSPAISSGVSMTFSGHAHFEHHVGLFSGQTVSPSDAIQMLRRDRTARHYLVGLGHSSSQRQTDRDALYRGMMLADEQTFTFEEDAGEVRFVRRKTSFDQLFLSSVTGENKARNDFSNNFLLMLISDGYQVHRTDLNTPEMIEASRKNRAVAGDLVFAQRMDLITNVEIPDEPTFGRLSRQEVRSERESAQVDRYHLAHQLGVDEPTADDVDFFDNKGISRVVAIELLQSSEEQVNAYDKAQRRAKVVVTQHRYKTAARELLLKVFEILGVDRFTGKGEFTAKQCREVLAMIRTDQNSLDLYNALKIGRLLQSLNVKACATTVVKSILERLGVTACKVRKTTGVNIFSIDSEQFEFIMGYVKRRATMGVHSLAIYEATSTHDPKIAPTNDVHATPDAAFQVRDTLQGEVIDLDENYPLSIREKIFAVASRCARPLGIPLAKVVGLMRRDTVMGWIKPGTDERQIGFELNYAATLMKKSGL